MGLGIGLGLGLGLGLGEEGHPQKAMKVPMVHSPRAER